MYFGPLLMLLESGFRCRESWPVWIKVSCWWSNLLGCRWSIIASFITEVLLTCSQGEGDNLQKFLLISIAVVFILLYIFSILSFGQLLLNSTNLYDAVCRLIPYFWSNVYVFTSSPRIWNLPNIGRLSMKIFISFRLDLYTIYWLGILN